MISQVHGTQRHKSFEVPVGKGNSTGDEGFCLA